MMETTLVLEILFAFILGIAAYFGSGIDDIVVMVAMLSNKSKNSIEKKKLFLQVGAGTILALLLVLLLSCFIVIKSRTFLIQFQWVAGLLLLYVGFTKFFAKSESRKFLFFKNNPLLLSFTIYLLNSTDDFLLYSAYFIRESRPFFQAIFIFGAIFGGLVAIILSEKIANFISTKMTKINFNEEKIIGVVISFIGLFILITSF